MTSRGDSTTGDDNDGKVVDMTAGPRGRIVTLDDILKSDDTARMEVSVPEWGNKTLFLRGLTKAQQAGIREQAKINDEVDEALVSKGIFREGVDEPKFTPEQVNAIWEKQAGVIDGILMTILRLSGMDKEASARWERVFRNRA